MFASLYPPLSNTARRSSSSVSRNCVITAVTIALILSLSELLPSRGRMKMGRSPSWVVTSPNIHCGAFGSVITGIAVGERDGDRFLFFVALFVPSPLRKILAVDGKRGRIDMHLLCLDPETSARLQGQSRKQSRRIMLIDPIQCPSHTIVIEHVGCDSCS